MASCTMTSCEFEATDTEPIIAISSQNRSEKPICSYHKYQRKLMESSLFPIAVFILTYGLVNLTGLATTGVGFFIQVSMLFLASLTVICLSLIVIEFIVRYIFMDIPIFRRTIVFTSESYEGSDKKRCCNCGECNSNGNLKRYEYTLQFIGTPIKSYNKGVNYYCSSCLSG